MIEITVKKDGKKVVDITCENEQRINKSNKNEKRYLIKNKISKMKHMIFEDDEPKLNVLLSKIMLKLTDIHPHAWYITNPKRSKKSHFYRNGVRACDSKTAKKLFSHIEDQSYSRPLCAKCIKKLMAEKDVFNVI